MYDYFRNFQQQREILPILCLVNLLLTSSLLKR
jgi:hypothetical protein